MPERVLHDLGSINHIDFQAPSELLSPAAILNCLQSTVELRTVHFSTLIYSTIPLYYNTQTKRSLG